MLSTHSLLMGVVWLIWRAEAEKLRNVLVAMKKAHSGDGERVKACFQTLLKFCGNVATNPGRVVITMSWEVISIIRLHVVTVHLVTFDQKGGFCF